MNKIRIVINDALTGALMFICIFLSLSSYGNKNSQPTGNEPPNLVLILVDQWTGRAMGFENHHVLTPNLDKLSRRSLVLRQMVSNFPVCSPARAMLLTGKYPLKNHVYTNVNSSSAPYGVELPKDIVCWSDILKANGYSNGYIGKWHLDSPHEPFVLTYNNFEESAWNEWTPPDRRHGFVYWYAYGTYDIHNHPMYWDTDAPRDSFQYVNEWGPVHEARKALAFLRNDEGKYRASGKPFSLVISMNPPHSEYKTVPQKYLNLYNDIPLDSLLKDPDIPEKGTPMGDFYREHIKYYYANITGVDEQVGVILKGLRDYQLDGNTIVVFMADHGNNLGKHNAISKNTIYEESLNIPFIIYWKGKIQPRIDDGFLGNLPDIYPTLLDLMGFKNSIPGDLDGRSYAEYFKTGKGDKPAYQYIMGAIISTNADINTGFRGIRTKQYKMAYVREGEEVKSYFFDLSKDPFEMNNIYDPKSEVVNEYRKYLISHMTEPIDIFEIPDK